MALDYKNADKKMLKENLKNTIQGLLREGTYDEYYTQQQRSAANNEKWKKAGMESQQQPAQQSAYNNMYNNASGIKNGSDVQPTGNSGDGKN